MTEEKIDTTTKLAGGQGEPERESVFELYESKIPRTCEQCKRGRPRVVFLRRLWGEQTKLAFVCAGCAAAFRSQGARAAAKITETLEANGGDVSVD